MSDVQKTLATKAIYFSVQEEKGPVQLLSALLQINRQKEVVELVVGQFDKKTNSVVPFTQVDFQYFQRITVDVIDEALVNGLKVAVTDYIHMLTTRAQFDTPMGKHLVKYLSTILDIKKDEIAPEIVEQAIELRSIFAFIIAYGATPDEMNQAQANEEKESLPVPLPAFEENTVEVEEPELDEKTGMMLSDLLKQAKAEQDAQAEPAAVEHEPQKTVAGMEIPFLPAEEAPQEEKVIGKTKSRVI